jgi:hypothetical protein
MPLVAASLAACTYIYGLDDLAGEPPTNDAGTSDGTGPSVPVADSGGGDALFDVTPLDAGFTIDCADRVVAHWPMDEGAGASVFDRCPLHLDGTLTQDDGGVARATRADGGCIELKGNAHVALGVRSELQLTGPFTVAGFIRMDQIPTGYVGLYWNLGGTLGFEIVLSYEARAYAQVGVADQTLGAPMGELLTGVWTHLAMVFEPNVRVEAFRDGASVGKTIPPNGPANKHPTPIRLGPVTPSSVWAGALDDVVVYSRALSASEIAALARR